MVPMVLGERLYKEVFYLSELWLVTNTVNWVKYCEATQFAMAATNHSALSSDEVSWDKVKCSEIVEILLLRRSSAGGGAAVWRVGGSRWRRHVHVSSSQYSRLQLDLAQLQLHHSPVLRAHWQQRSLR